MVDDEVAPEPQPSTPSVEAPPGEAAVKALREDLLQTAAEVAALLPEPQPPAITPADEAFQALIDRDTLAQALQEARTQLSQLKVAYWLSRSGIDIKKHPKQIAIDIAGKRLWIDILVQMFREDGPVKEPAPEPTAKLEVVGGHLTNGVNTP